METETKVQHTEGPWNFHEYYNPLNGPIGNCGFDYKSVTIAKGEKRLAEAIWDNSESGGYATAETVEEMEANARLMMTSPELLEVLQVIISNAMLAPDPRMNNATDCYLVTLDDIEAARAVVEKATSR